MRLGSAKRSPRAFPGAGASPTPKPRPTASTGAGAGGARRLRAADRGGAGGPGAAAAAPRRHRRGLRPDAILVMNTSSLPVTAIAAASRSRSGGRHALLHPPALMKLVEVVAAAESSEQALRPPPRSPADGPHADPRPRHARLRRQPPRPAVRPGVAADARRRRRPRGDDHRAVRLGGGFRMGPFELIDLIGLDVNLSIAAPSSSRAASRSAGAQPDPGAAGRGRQARPQSGQGYFSYGEGIERGSTPSWGSWRRRSTREAGPGRPRRRGDPQPALRPDRQRGHLRPGRRGRLPRRHGHGDAARPRLAAGPFSLAEKIAPRRVRLCRSLSASGAPPTHRRRCCCGRPNRGSSCARARGEAEHQLIRVTPAPVLARLGRADDRVPGRLVVGRRVFADRVVAAADVAAGLAHPQVDPPHPLRQALLAPRDLVRQVEVLDRVEVGALNRHG